MCIFCKIVAEEIPSDVVFEDENFLAFKDINPIAPIHFLIIPKEHIDSFQEIGGLDLGRMGLFIQELVKKYDLDKKGYRLVTNIGEDGGQEVKHLHFHLLAGAKLKWPKVV